MWLFFGCRQKCLDLYAEEKKKMVDANVLDKAFLALSREPGLQKVYIFVKFVYNFGVHVDTKSIQIIQCSILTDICTRFNSN